MSSCTTLHVISATHHQYCFLLEKKIQNFNNVIFKNKMLSESIGRENWYGENVEQIKWIDRFLLIGFKIICLSTSALTCCSVTQILFKKLKVPPSHPL